MYVCMYVCMSIYIYLYMYVCLYIYIYIYVDRQEGVKWWGSNKDNTEGEIETRREGVDTIWGWDNAFNR